MVGILGFSAFVLFLVAFGSLKWNTTPQDTTGWGKRLPLEFRILVQFQTPYCHWPLGKDVKDACNLLKSRIQNNLGSCSFRISERILFILKENDRPGSY